MIHTDSDSLTLYFYPSPYGIDWQNPKRLAWSTLKNALSRKGRKIGHVSVEIEQKKGAETLYREHVGMTDVDKSLQYKLLLRDGIGPGIIFYNFAGTLESAEKLDPEIHLRAKDGRISFIKFLISRSTSERVKTYLHEYRARGGHYHYGLPNRPRYDEGAGCSAYGASFLDVAGILLPEFQESWTQEIHVSEKLIGPPVGKKPVNLLKLLFSDEGNQWTHEGSPSRKIYFWEPDRMHQFVLRSHALQNSKMAGSPKFLKHENAFGFLFDFREHPTPNEPIWLTPSKS